MTRIACAQLAPQVGDLEANRALALEAVRASIAGGAQIVVLPELVTSGYMFASTEEAASVAITPEHALFEDWAAAAARGEDALVIGGFCEQGEDGELYNSAAVVDGSGVIAVYRKTHLWDREKLFFTPGAVPPPVLDTVHGRIAVLICYDLEFCELTRGLALAGTDLITVPTNWPLVPHPPGEHAPEVVIAMAAARSNRMAIACCDRTGTERGQDWNSATSIIGVDGWIAATADGVATAVADVDLAAARDKRLTEYADALGDRRPELYAGTLAPPV